MLDFIKFQERKILNELAVRIDHQKLERKLKTYTSAYMYKIDMGPYLDVAGFYYEMRNEEGETEERTKQELAGDTKAYKNPLALLKKAMKMGITHDEFKLMFDYKESSTELNNTLRGGEGLYADGEMRKLTKKSPVIKPGILWRVIGYTGDSGVKDMIEEFDKGNRAYENKGYMSCSWDPKFPSQTAGKGKLLLKILCPKSYRGIVLNQVGKYVYGQALNEAEVILPRNNKFLINSINDKVLGGYEKEITLTLISQKI